jgi:hypothetical protein
VRHSGSEASVLDIRTYRTVPGGRDELVRIMTEEAVPMLRRHGIEVVAFGPSLQDDDLALLIRFFGSMQRRNEQLEGFYGSEEWLSHYDERVMALIASYHVVVIPASRDAATALAAARPPGG